MLSQAGNSVNVYRDTYRDRLLTFSGNYEEHCAKHNVFRDRSDSLSAGMDHKTDMDTFTVQMSRWLIEWFCDQAQTDDMKLAAFLNRRQT